MSCVGVSFRKITDLKAVEGDWGRLLERCWANNPCSLIYWHRAWWEEFGHQKERLLLGYVDQGTVKGIAPLVYQDGVVTFSGGQDLCDYMDFLVCKGEEEPFYRGLVQFMDCENWDRMELYSIPQESPTLEYLPGIAREAGYDVGVSKEDPVPGLVLPDSWDEYLSSLRKKERHELRRKFRRLERAEGVRFYSLDSEVDVEENLGAFFQLLRLSRDDKASFLTPQRESFFRAVAKEAAREGTLRLFFLEMDGVKVSAALSFDYRGQRFLYNSGFDPEYGYYSVGLLLKALCLKDAIERRLEYFDFLRGSEAYKYHLGGKDRWVYQMTLSRR